MRVVFAGTPPFAVPSLAALHAAGHDIALVLTQPDRPAGRGLKLAPSAVGEWGEAHGLRVFKPGSLKDEAVCATFREADAELMVVAAYGLILPPAVLEIPPRGCLNVHASLLPRWRGAAPIQRALLAGDERTGVSIMRMEPGLDTGPILLERGTPIGPRDTAGTLGDRLAEMGALAIVETLAGLDRLVPRPQDAARATYAPKVAKSEARIDWSDASTRIDRQVRAFNPAPGAETTLGHEVLKVWEARLAEGRGEPGAVIEAGAAGLVVACGQGALRIEVLQKAGGRRMGCAEFQRGTSVPAGAHLGAGPRTAPAEGGSS